MLRERRVAAAGAAGSSSRGSADSMDSCQPLWASIGSRRSGTQPVPLASGAPHDRGGGGPRTRRPPWRASSRAASWSTSATRSALRRGGRQRAAGRGHRRSPVLSRSALVLPLSSLPVGLGGAAESAGTAGFGISHVRAKIVSMGSELTGRLRQYSDQAIDIAWSHLDSAKAFSPRYLTAYSRNQSLMRHGLMIVRSLMLSKAPTKLLSRLTRASYFTQRCSIGSAPHLS